MIQSIHSNNTPAIASARRITLSDDKKETPEFGLIKKHISSKALKIAKQIIKVRFCPPFTFGETIRISPKYLSTYPLVAYFPLALLFYPPKTEKS